MLKIFAAFILFVGVVDFVYQLRRSFDGGLNNDWLICLVLAVVTILIDLRLSKLESIIRHPNDFENRDG